MLITADGYVHLTKSLHRRLDPQCKSDFMFKLDKHIKFTDVTETEMKLQCSGSFSESLMNMLRKRHTHTDESFEFTVSFTNPEEKLSFRECIAMILGS